MFSSKFTDHLNSISRLRFPAWGDIRQSVIQHQCEISDLVTNYGEPLLTVRRGSFSTLELCSIVGRQNPDNE